MRERARRSTSYVRLLATVQCSIPSPVLSSHPAPPCSNLTKFYFEPMTVSAVLKRLSSLDTIKALGLDGVSNQFLKECASVLAEPLTHIFNVSFEKCCFPHRWKQAVVKPLYKRKGAKNDPASYRPIALLPCVSKILEGLAPEQLLSHCSVLGPLLLIIYFRNLPSVVKSCCAMFADDTLLYDCDCNSGSVHVSLAMNNEK